MCRLANVVYHPLMEEPNSTKGWNKQTITYMIENRYDMCKKINSMSRKLYSSVTDMDVDDIYINTLQYFYKADDYNISTAYERSNDPGTCIDLEGYVNSILKYKVVDYVSKMIHHSKHHVPQTAMEIYEEDKKNKEVNIIDIINPTVDDYDELFIDLDETCKQSESMRYDYSLDLFQIWYVRLLTIQYRKSSTYNDILNIIGISDNDMKLFEKQSKYSEVMLDMAKAISIIGMKKSLEILKHYVYSADRIEKIICMY